MRQTRRTTSSKKNKKQQIQQQEQQTSFNCQFITKNYSKFLDCPQCKKLMSEPMRLHPCGHTFCHKCLSGKKCSLCKKNCAIHQTDLIAQGLINELPVRCLNSGCPYKSSFEEYKKYHKECAMKSGLDQWLRSLKGTLDEHADTNSRKYNFQDQQERQHKSQKLPEVQDYFQQSENKSKGNNNSKKKIERDLKIWQKFIDQEQFGKVIRKQQVQQE